VQTAIGPISAHRQGSLPPVTVSVLEAPTAPEDTVVSRNIVTGNLGDGILVDSGGDRDPAGPQSRQPQRRRRQRDRSV
jgi:hypothetical protein